MKKKLVSTLMAMSMVAGLCGCGANTEATTAATTAATAAATEAAKETQAAETTAAEEVAANDFSEKVTLKALAYYKTGEKDWNEYYFVKKIEEKFNVDLQIEMIDSTVWKEKYPLLFASKDSLPDFIICNYGGAIDINLYGDQGYLADLTDYVNETTAPNIMKMWEESPSTKGVGSAATGEVYAIVGSDNEPRGLDNCRFFINKEWANEILGKLPENTDELYEYFVGVKEKDMDGDGDANDEIPLGGYYSMSNGINPLTMLRNAYGLLDKNWQVGDDGKVFHTRSSENYKEMLKYTNKLFEEGLLDNEFFTQTKDQFSAKNSEYLYGAFGAWGAHENRTGEDVTALKYHVYDGMPVLTSPVNDEKMWSATDLKATGQITVMSKCENVDRVVAIADWLISEEGYMATQAGPQFDEDEKYPDWGYTGEKHNWEVVDREGKNLTYPEAYNDHNSFVYGERRPNGSSVPFYRYWSQTFSETSTGYHLQLATTVAHSEYYTVGYPVGATLTQDENDELTLVMTDIDSFAEEMESKMIMGELDIDANWDAYLEGLKLRGIDTALQIKQDAYDRYVAN
ncbi:MAG: hypothetical protein IJ374_12010 [Lachnospiraceae bacterium]|nr:hypothetical protein [Lachnospiraceae bacterium]